MGQEKCYPPRKGPVVAGRGEFSEDEIEIVCKICAFYCKYDKNLKIKIIQLPDKEKFIIINEKIKDDFINKYKIG